MSIARKGQVITRALVERTHPDYAGRKDDHELHWAAFTGGGGFAGPNSATVGFSRLWNPDDLPTTREAFEQWFTSEPSFEPTYLAPNLREGRGFELRWRRAHYENRIKRAVMVLAGFLTKQEPTYDAYLDPCPLLSAWLGSVTSKRLSWHQWLQTEVVPWLCVYGEVTAVFDRPLVEARNMAEQQAAGADRVRGRIIHPMNLLDWRRREDGELDWIKFVESVDATPDPMAEVRGVTTRTRWISSEGWWYVDEVVVPGSKQEKKDDDELKVSAAGLWDPALKGRPPIACWRLGEDGESLIKEPAQAAVAHYNATSRLEHLLSETAFPMMTGPEYPGDNAAAVKVVGPQNMLMYPPDSTHPPHWISPDSAPFQVFAARLAKLEEAIDQMMGLGVVLSGVTGVAKAFDAAELARFLCQLAADVAEGEHQAHQVVARLYREELPEEAKAVWPVEFDAVDAERLVQRLSEFIKAGPGPTAIGLALGRMTSALLPGLDSGQRAAIRKEQMDEAQTPGGDAVPPGMMPGPDEDTPEPTPPAGPPPPQAPEPPQAQAR